MRFYYSGAAVFLGIQQDIRISLGGFRSNSLVPNDFLDNLFSDISLYTERQGEVATKAVFLVNETGSDVTNLEAYFNFDADTIATMELAVVEVANGEEMEKIPNYRGTPYNANFFQADGVANKVLITPLLPADGVLGFWFRRVVEPTPAPTCEELLEDEELGVVKSQIETVELVLDWV